jgi:hypothetical protein
LLLARADEVIEWDQRGQDSTFGAVAEVSLGAQPEAADLDMSFRSAPVPAIRGHVMAPRSGHPQFGRIGRHSSSAAF